MRRLRGNAVTLVLALVLGPGCTCDGGGGGTDASTPADSGGGGTDAGPPIDPSDELYAWERFPTFEIELSAASIASLMSDPRTYVTGTFHYGSETVYDIGVRLKGEWNFRELYAKAAFKLKFDEFVPDQRFRGLKRMTFNNSLEDPSFVAERLVYKSFRDAGLPAPRCNNAQIYVNGELYGVYVNVETEDKTFLSRWFASNDGNLYEELGYDWFPGNEYGFELETNETIDDRSDLTALFAAIEAASDDTLLADVSSVLDTTHLLHYSALEGIVNQWDGYAYTIFGPNNYRLYHDPSTGLFTLLPWGMDMAMKPCCGADWVDLWAITGYLLQRCAGSSTCLPAYEAAMNAEIDTWEALGLATWADSAYWQIRDAVYADPRNEWSTGDFEATYAGVLDFIATRPGVVRAQLP